MRRRAGRAQSLGALSLAVIIAAVACSNAVPHSGAGASAGAGAVGPATGGDGARASGGRAAVNGGDTSEGGQSSPSTSGAGGESDGAAGAAHDLVVYGCTSAGVIAAVQAAHMHKSVILVCPEQHLGGLTSQGLGWTDTGDNSVIGGLSRDFYARIQQAYGDDARWKQQTKASANRGRNICDFR